MAAPSERVPFVIDGGNPAEVYGLRFVLGPLPPGVVILGPEPIEVRNCRFYCAMTTEATDERR